VPVPDYPQIPELEGRSRHEWNEAERYYSYLLEREAERWGVEIPKSSEFYDFAGTTNPEAPLRTLNEQGRARVSKQVRAARLAYWKTWIQLLVPILALIVAILALMKK
jgi:hypothetical protein